MTRVGPLGTATYPPHNVRQGTGQERPPPTVTGAVAASRRVRLGTFAPTLICPPWSRGASERGVPCGPNGSDTLIAQRCRYSARLGDQRVVLGGVRCQSAKTARAWCIARLAIGECGLGGWQRVAARTKRPFGYTGRNPGRDLFTKFVTRNSSFCFARYAYLRRQATETQRARHSPLLENRGRETPDKWVENHMHHCANAMG